MKNETTHQINFDMNEYTFRVTNKIQDLTYFSLIEIESGEEHRAFRLNNIISAYKIYCDEHNMSFDKLSSMLDHKGELLVSWNERPDSHEIYIIAKIWEIFGNELSENVKHYLLTAVQL